MKKYVKKVYLSIMLVVFSLLTMVATTYAWVGLLTSTTFDEFTINLQQSDDPDASEYGIEVSLDGINFYDSISSVDIRRKLLENLNYNVSDYNDNAVNDVFRRHKVSLCTTTVFGDRLNSEFRDMKGNITHNYYWFDLYVSIYKVGSEDSSSQKNLDLYLRDYILSASTSTNPSGIYEYKLFNSVAYPNYSDTLFGKKILGDSSIANSISEGTVVANKVKIDIANTCRVALDKYVAVDKKHPEQYDSIYGNKGVVIYQNGSQYPTYNSSTGVYDFGGVLPDEYNFARLYHNSLHSDITEQLGSVPNEIINRGDLVYNDDGVCNHLITQSDGVTTSKMTKFRIYFWFEGWDSDCFEVIDNKTVTLNLTFSTKSPNEE